MAEQMARVSPTIELCYETFGDPATSPRCCSSWASATQMLGWHEDFCEELAGRGFFVIRFDNRDCGRSTTLTDRTPPTLGQMLRRERDAAAYSLADMAGDAVGLLDAPRHRARARRRRLDGRDDRPDDRDPLPRARALARLDHVQHRRRASAASRRSTSTRSSSSRPRATARATSSTRASCSTRSARPASSATRPSCATIVGRSFDRGVSAAGQRPPARRRSSPTATARRSCASSRARAGHPRHRRPARAPVGRPRDRQGDPRRAAAR